jgi:hypothetical protein
VGQDQERIAASRAAELLFADSSKNFSDLKSREWNATYYSVLAIVGLAVLVHGFKPPAACQQQVAATSLMSLIFVAHWVATWKCEKNLDVFRERIKKLLGRYFSEESRELFQDDPEFKSAVVDEGRITFILYASTPVTLAWALFVVWLL